MTLPSSFLTLCLDRYTQGKGMGREGKALEGKKMKGMYFILILFGNIMK